MSDRVKRPRLSNGNMKFPIKDEMEFRENLSSSNARKRLISKEEISIELWYDKHYYGREREGDLDGQREGIDFDSVEDLVLNSIKHLLFHSSCVKGFAFLNHDCQPNDIRNIRIVCKKEIDSGMLNVVIEVHHMELHKYEVTVRTAMNSNNFKISDGQYFLQLLDNETSVLSKLELGRIKEIHKN